MQLLDDLLKWDRPVPRYTSYPTAPQFQAIEESVARERLRAFDRTERPLSLYLHIPFCRTMCLFCGCSVILNRKPEKQAAYLDLLIREIELVASQFRSPRLVTEVHFGGGTPTSLNEEEFARLTTALRRCFAFGLDAQWSIEIDPRTVYGDRAQKLKALRDLGFNRVSFGVQDLDPAVQEAVRRRQSEEMTVQTLAWARELGFCGINVDLIYGLPLQTEEKFRRTAHRLAELQPDRIALFSYAKVPWLKKHQQAIAEEDLPSSEEKFRIYAAAREIFIDHGYIPIGMDHFARENDELAVAYRENRLYRNFQGYSVKRAEDLLGLGVTSIGFIEGAFLQNVKTIEEYGTRLDRGMLPVLRGVVLSEEDLLRQWVIQQIMCRFALDKREFFWRYRKSFNDHFSKERNTLNRLNLDGLIEEDEERMQATEKGQLFIRFVAAAFDAYLIEDGTFSRGI